VHPVLALALAYVAGSIPTAYLAGRLLKGVDLRTVGSGNLGATNVYRSLGAPTAAVVLLLDALKGALPALLLPARMAAGRVADPDALLWWGLGCGVMAILGHARPVFLLWRGGGKGVATAAGVFAALSPAAFALALAAFALVFWRARIVSLASLVAAAALPIGAAATAGVGSPLFIVALAVGGFVTWSHRANIARLRAGTEPRLASRPSEVAE
jgi:glycerol-3-phosphate acyltransferase PlsY